MPVINTEVLNPKTRLSISENTQIYCGLDSCVTLEVFEELSRTYQSDLEEDSPASIIYNFERALQAPYLEIMQRGFLINEAGRLEAAELLRGRIAALQATLNEFAMAVWDRPLNPRSPVKLQEFFYGALKLPEVWISQKGQRKLSTNREALEKLSTYLYARPFVNLILGIRDLAKQLEIFETSIDPDLRFRAAYNIAGTETGRPSSSENAFGTGRNAQNIAPSLRWVFIADRGWKLCVIDLEQVEARDCGFFIGCLFDDWRFLDACESGDLHTSNSRLIWPDLAWTGDLKSDRKIAEGQFYREFSYRDFGKRGGHLTHYFGTPWTASRVMKVPIHFMEDFRKKYVSGGVLSNGQEVEAAYPGFPLWWEWTAAELQTTQQLITPFGRRRHFFGRPGDDTTLREAIAFLPQSTTADRMNLGMWRVWKQLPQIQLLAQTYDSITFQYPESADETSIIQQALELVQSIPLTAPNGRRYSVPGEAKVGWNWGAKVTQDDIDKAVAAGKKPPRLNLRGLSKWRKP